MSMVRHDLEEDDISLAEETKVAVMAPSTAGALNKSEVEAQLDAAHKYGRSIHRFLTEAVGLATFDKEVAMSCIYALPRGGKVISGPSIRLAEICASAYGNLHMGARVVGIEDKEIVAQGVCWDLEKNNRVTMEVRRRITNSKGGRYNDDMIVMTGNAAASIGLRNAIFRIIPKAYVNAVYQKAREVSVGNARTLSETRTKVIERLTKMGITQERVLHRISRASVDDVTLDDVELLIGLGTAIKDGNTNIDEAFPEPEKITTEKGKSAIDKIVEAKKAEQVTGRKPDAPIPCDKSDFDQLEILGTEYGIGPKKWRKHIEETMGFASWETLTKDRLEEVQKWIRANGKVTQ